MLNVDDENKLRSIMGIGANGDGTSSSSFSSLQMYSDSGSSPLMTISWTRLDNRTLAGRIEGLAMLTAG